MIETPRTANAMANIRKIFSHYEKPKEISACTQCYKYEDYLKWYVSLPLEKMTDKEFHEILFNGCRCFGGWDEIAYYIPTLMENWSENKDELYRLFLCAACVKLNPMITFLEGIESEMGDIERKAIFEFAQASFEADLEATDDIEDWIITETVSFLGAFDTPIEPLLKRLEQSERRSTRASFCVFVGEHVSGQATFDDGLLHNYSMLPENQKAIDALFAPERALGILFSALEDVALIDSEALESINRAFDVLTSK